MRPIRCTAGLHAWERHVVREGGGQKSLHQRCTRCGRERTRPVALDPKLRPDTGEGTRPRDYWG